jgi:hypothetical protein
MEEKNAEIAQTLEISLNWNVAGTWDFHSFTLSNATRGDITTINILRGDAVKSSCGADRVLLGPTCSWTAAALGQFC